MSPPHEHLRDVVQARFREAFGESHARAGGGANWSLASAASNGPRVHVVVTGWAAGPCVWVFDPHDQAGGVAYDIINDIAQIEEVIADIRSRVCLPGPPPACPNPGLPPGPAPPRPAAP